MSLTSKRSWAQFGVPSCVVTSNATGMPIAPSIWPARTLCIRSTPYAMVTSHLAIVQWKLSFPRTTLKKTTTLWRLIQATDATTLHARRQVNAMLHAGMRGVAEGQSATSLLRTISGTRPLSKSKILRQLTCAEASSALMMISASMAVLMLPSATTTSPIATVHSWSKYMMIKLRRRSWSHLWIDASSHLARVLINVLMAMIVTMVHA